MKKIGNLTHSPASRYSPISHHMEYGIYNFLAKKGVKDSETQNEIIDTFLKEQQFEEKEFYKQRVGEKATKMQFIQNRFNKFYKFVMNYNPLDYNSNNPITKP